MELAFLDCWLGECVPVLFEEERDGAWRGYTAEYVPVAVQSEEDLHNRVCQVKLTERRDNVLWGELN